ncbi:MAG: hypothetical protein KGL39_41140, partial [Patescibacteria group bacterium]|nr:hypothetical protein [Patescibacteria group bacterium]
QQSCHLLPQLRKEHHSVFSIGYLRRKYDVGCVEILPARALQFVRLLVRGNNGSMPAVFVINSAIGRFNAYDFAA